ncbi:hypothetical protein FA13DRAFT_1650797, partial [Coprinellus micaceus]
VLVTNGVFPCSPRAPRVAVDINLLSLYHAQWEKACEAVNAISGALGNHYARRGFPLRNSKGELIRDGYRKSIAAAMLWHANLIQKVDAMVETSIGSARDALHSLFVHGSQGMKSQELPTFPHPATSEREVQLSTSTGEKAVRAVSPDLLRKCSACFGKKCGEALERGGDYHISCDGCFAHRHIRSAGDCPEFCIPALYIPKEYVDAVGVRIGQARQAEPKRTTPKVADDAVNECERGHIAANGTNVKTSMDKYDDTGTMALVCRHDIPLFLANIDTPGEQQKYAVALIEKLYSLLPENATVTIFYDIGCVLERTLQKWDILPDSITSRLRFATSAMHAYAHQWACQVVYNPRMQPGLGLSDGEGTERLWSRLRKLIGPSRHSHRQKRLHMIDRLTHSVAVTGRNDLGDWLRRKMKKVQEHRSEAQKKLDDMKVPINELRSHWDEQLKAQSSIRSYRPAKLTKELDSVLKLHNDVHKLNSTLKAMISDLSKGEISTSTPAMLASLQGLQTEKYDQIESLYDSLNVGSSFPELDGIPLGFVRNLLLARDLKINIRKRAIANFFEWDKLHQAAGGQSQALGTSLHQITSKGIAKRKPALITAIKKFNNLTVTLAEQNQPQYNIPLPGTLPEDLSKLRADESQLWEDVWINRCEGKQPMWFSSGEVRDGVRAMMKLDRCNEEIRRLGKEADNMCNWYGDELSCLEVALFQVTNPGLRFLLQARKEHLLALKAQWYSPLASEARYLAQIERAQQAPGLLGLQPQEKSHTWLPISMSGPVRLAPEDAGRDVLVEDMREEEELLGEEVAIQDFLEQEADYVIFLRSNLDVRVSQHARSHRILVSDGENRRSIEFSSMALDILSARSERLSDLCINEGAWLLQHLTASCPEFRHSAANCAVFSSYLFRRAQAYTGGYDIWRNARQCSYWSKKVWIIPIHRIRPEHWVVCIAYPASRLALLFDSLCDEAGWRSDLPALAFLLESLVNGAKENGHDILSDDTQKGWEAYPLNTAPVQRSSDSCGLWVLAQIGAVLQGSHLTALEEPQMEDLRRMLYLSVLNQPHVAA